MTKKSLLNLILVMGFIFNNSSLANTLVVNFEGNLQVMGCRLSDDSAIKEVVLTNLRFSSLENQGQSDIQPFTLDIVDCSTPALNKTIKLVLAPHNTEIHNGISYLQTAGGSNVLLALTDNNGKELLFNTPLDISTITQSGKGSVNTLLLGVYAKKPFSGQLNAESFSSLVTFSLDYQ